MKIFILIIFFIFSLQSWTKADDIRDFEIEGMSIGDSLLNFFSEKEIKNNTLDATYPKNNSMRRVSFKLENKIFEYIEIHYKQNDKTFIIYGILGSLFFKNFDNCYKKSKEISIVFLLYSFPLIASIVLRVICPPSNKGIGNKLTKPRLIEM